VSSFLKNFPDKKTFINGYTIEDEESLEEVFPGVLGTGLNI